MKFPANPCAHTCDCVSTAAALSLSIDRTAIHSFPFGCFTSDNKNAIDRAERVERKKNPRTKHQVFTVSFDKPSAFLLFWNMIRIVYPRFPVWSVVFIAFVSVSLSRCSFFFCFRWKNYFDYLCRIKYTYHTLKIWTMHLCSARDRSTHTHSLTCMKCTLKIFLLNAGSTTQRQKKKNGH